MILKSRNTAAYIFTSESPEQTRAVSERTRAVSERTRAVSRTTRAVSGTTRAVPETTRQILGTTRQIWEQPDGTPEERTSGRHAWRGRAEVPGSRSVYAGGPLAHALSEANRGAWRRTGSSSYRSDSSSDHNCSQGDHRKSAGQVNRAAEIPLLTSCVILSITLV